MMLRLEFARNPRLRQQQGLKEQQGQQRWQSRDSTSVGAMSTRQVLVLLCNVHEVQILVLSNQILVASMSEWAVQPGGRIFCVHACLLQTLVHKQPPVEMAEQECTGQGRGEQDRTGLASYYAY